VSAIASGAELPDIEGLPPVGGAQRLDIQTLPPARYPLADLEALVGCSTSAELAERVGVTRQAVHQWRHRGLSERQADEVACRLGWWPGLVWPEWLGGG
jgi:hypothetical protein